jgi:hypothetical protein
MNDGVRSRKDKRPAADQHGLRHRPSTDSLILQHVLDPGARPVGKLVVHQVHLDSGLGSVVDRAGGSYLDRRGLPVRGYVEQHSEESGSLQLLRSPLTDKNWRIYAAKNYDNPQCIGEDEFESDLKRFKYIKKALTRRAVTGELCERLILNHLIVLCNVFGPAALVRLVYLKMADQLHLIKPFLVLLQVLPERVYAVAGKDWNTDEVAMDPEIVSALRRI